MKYIKFICYATGAAMLSLGCVFAIQSMVFMHGFVHANDQITDPAKYPELLAKFRTAGLATHFPDQYASNAHALFFSPGFLQAPTVLQLLVTVNDSQLDTIIQLSAEQFPPSEANSNPRTSPCPYILWQLEPLQSKERELPSSYEILVHRGKGTNNHGTIEGIAVDRKNKLVLYYSENW